MLHLHSYTWLAELYVVYVKRSKDLPGEVIEGIVKHCMEERDNLERLEGNCRVLYKWIQERIDCLKHEAARFDQCGSSDLDVLSSLYKNLYVVHF